jgi:WS/DGAT/MGAT family acyltransferase
MLILSARTNLASQESTEAGAVPPDDSPAVADERLDGWRLLRDTVAFDVGALARATRDVPAAVAHAARHPLDVLRTAASVARTVEPYFTTLSPVMRARRMERSLAVLEVPLTDLRAAAKAHGGHLNDAFLTAVTGGLRRYHAHHGHAVESLRVTLPISLRTDTDPEGGNRITLMRFTLPTATEHPGERLWATHHVVERVRRERSLAHKQGIATALNLLPSGFVGSMLKHVDFLASDVPGVTVPLYLAGARVTSWYAFGPTIGASVNVTLMSYEDRCCIGINIDTGAVPDPDVLVASLREGFAEVLALVPA